MIIIKEEKEADKIKDIEKLETENILEIEIEK